MIHGSFKTLKQIFIECMMWAFVTNLPYLVLIKPVKLYILPAVNKITAGHNMDLTTISTALLFNLSGTLLM